MSSTILSLCPTDTPDDIDLTIREILRTGRYIYVAQSPSTPDQDADFQISDKSLRNGSVVLSAPALFENIDLKRYSPDGEYLEVASLKTAWRDNIDNVVFLASDFDKLTEFRSAFELYFRYEGEKYNLMLDVDGLTIGCQRAPLVHWESDARYILRRAGIYNAHVYPLTTVLKTAIPLLRKRLPSVAKRQPNAKSVMVPLIKQVRRNLAKPVKF